MKIFYLVVCWGSLAALPQSPIIVEGTVSLEQPNSNTLEITASDRAIIDWSEFSIGANESTHFIQPSVSSSVLNRVIMNYPSQLLGQMTSNGQVILINPNGVLVGRNAIINTGSFIASTLDLQNSVYLARQELLFEGASKVVTHEGSINASHGDVILLGHSVNQLGTIDALQGDVALIAAPSVVLRGTGIQGMYVRSSAGGDPFEGAFVHFEGTTNAPGRTAYMLGDSVNLKAGLVDVSNVGQGGQIYVGGSYQGGDSNIPGSLSTQVGPNMLLKASGLVDGVGGKVVVWSDGRTDFQGRIESTGGSRGGDVEVSGLRELNYKGLSDLRSFGVDGVYGTLLLDPSDILIGNFGGVSNPALVPPVYDPAVASAMLDVTDLSMQLMLGSIVVQTNAGAGGNGDITLQPDFIGGINWAANTKITLRAQRHLILNDNITAVFPYTGVDDQIELIADSGNAGIGDIRVYQTAFNLQISTMDGAISMRGANILIGDIASGGSVDINALGAQGRFTAATPGLLNLQCSNSGGSVSVNSSGDQTITAGDWKVIGSTAAVFQANWSSSAAITATVFGETRVQSITSGIGNIGAQILADIFRLQTGNLTILGGTSNTNSNVLVQTTGLQNFQINGNFTIDAGSFNTTNARLISGSMQTIQAASLQMTGGDDVNSNAEIISNGTQMISVTGPITMIPGSSNTTHCLITADMGDQTIICNSLAMQGGISLLNADSRITCTLGNQTVRAGVLTMTGGTTPGQSSAVCDIQAVAGTQRVNSSAINMTAGDQSNTEVLIRSAGDQTINCTGDINMSGILGPYPASILSTAAQNISAQNINMFGSTLINSTGIQTINVVQDFSMFGGINAGVSATVQAANIQQIATIGGNLTMLGDPSGGFVNWLNGDNSVMTIAGNWTQFGNGSQASFSGQSNLTVDVGGNYQLDSTTGTNAGFSCNDNLNMHIRGDLLIGSPGSLGDQAFNITNNIAGGCTIRIDNNCTLIGGSAPFSSSYIDTRTDYYIAVGNDILCQAGSGIFANAYFGQQFITNPGVRLLIAGNDISFLGGTGQSFAYSMNFSNHEIRTGRDLFVSGGSGTGAEAFVFGVAISSGVPVRIGLQAGRDIYISGGASAGGSSFGYLEVFNGELALSSGRDIYMNAGSGSNTNSALIGAAWVDFNGLIPNVDDFTQTIIQPARSFIAQNGPANSIAYIDVVASGIIEPTLFRMLPIIINNNGSYSILAPGDITLARGLHTSEAIVPFNTLIHDIEMVADSPLAAGALWTGTPDPFLSGTPLFSASPAIAQNVLGGFKVDTGLIGNGIALTSDAGDIHVSSSDHFTNAVTANLIIGPISAQNDLTLNSISGDITVDPFHNITIVNPVTTGGNVLIIAQNNIIMTSDLLKVSTGLINAGGNVELVCDNQAPIAPLVGPGAFLMDASTSITAGGALRIFTARQSQNSILGSLNALFFTPGAVFVDTNQEMWCVYYPDPILGTPYTVFYKECLGSLVAQAGTIISEFLVDLNPYGLYFPGWIERFSIDWPNEIEPYFIRRRQLKPFNNPKTHLDL